MKATPRPLNSSSSSARRFMSRFAALTLAAAATFGWAASAQAQVFSNTTAITTPTGSTTATGNGTPYPSSIVVAGGPTISSVEVRLCGAYHSNPDDWDILLVGPLGSGVNSVMLMSDAGGTNGISNAVLTFADGSPAVPDSTQIMNGTYAPTDYTVSGTEMTGAPAGPYAATFMGAYFGASSNGTWSLYVRDDASTNMGAIQGGWSIRFNGTGTFPACPTATINPTEHCGSTLPALTCGVPVFGTVVTAFDDYRITATSPPYSGLGQSTNAAEGRDVVYSFTPPSTGLYSFKLHSLSPAGANPVLYVAGSCPGVSSDGVPVTVTAMSASNRNSKTSNFTASEEVMCLALLGGTPVYVFVDQTTQTAESPFILDVSACNRETEANDTPATANAFVQGMELTMATAADADFVSMGTPAAGSRLFAAVFSHPANNNDTQLRVTTATDTLEFDDDDGHTTTLGNSGFAPVIGGTPLTAVPTFIRVNTFSTASEPHRLFAVIRGDSTTAIAESEVNDTAAAADSDASNYFTGIISASTDVDYFSFSAAVGDVIFIGLDNDPTRTANPFNGNVALRDAGDVEILAAADSNASSSTTASPGTLVGTTPNSPADAILYRVPAGGAGTYYARVTGTVGANIEDYLLSIVVIPASCAPDSATPANDACAAAQPLTLGVSANGNTAFATNDGSSTCDATGRDQWYSVTIPGTTGNLLKVDTCGSDIDTVVSVYSGACGSLTQVDCNDDCAGSPCGGTSSCVSVAGLPSGTYLIRVSDKGIGSGGAFQLFASYGPPNDECAGAAVVTAGLVAYSHARATTSTSPAPCSTITKDLWYVFTAPAGGGTLTVTNCGQAPTGYDTVIALYSGTCGALTQLVCNDDGGACTDLEASASAFLTGGQSVYIRFGTFSTVAAQSGNLDVSFMPVAPNDTCAAPVALALETPVAGTLAANNDYELSGSACFTGVGHTESTAPGRDLAYSFTAPSAGSYSFRVLATTSGSNLVLYVASSCPSGTAPVTVTTCLGAANRTSSSTALIATEEVMCLGMSSGEQVFVIVDQHTLSSKGSLSSFTLEVTRCTAETEANGTPGTANAFVFGMEGSINPAADVDFYALGAPAAGSRVFALVDGNAGNSTDFDLRVTTTTDTLEYDDSHNDSPFGSLSPNVGGTPLTGVASYLRVNHFSATTIAEPYRIYAIVQPPSASATAESEPNDTTGTADSAANNYFSGASVTPDLDVYSFTANAGDLIFLSVDGDPLRNNTPFDPILRLLDSSGALLLEVQDTGSTSSITTGAGNLAATTPNSPAEAMVWRARTSGTYYAAVVADTTPAAGGDYLLSIMIEPCLIITSQPANQVACEGGSATFMVTHSGTPAVSYQWRRGTTPLVNGGNISGADTATLTINPVSLGDADDDYNVVITTSCFTTETSNDAELVVPQPPDEMNPAATPPTVCAGSRSTLSVDPQPAGIEVEWFLTSDCSGTPFATGESVNVMPTSDTTYYVHARTVSGGCVGACDSVTVTTTTPPTWYHDFDGDGFGDPGDPEQACTAPPDHVADNTDCDDTDEDVHPGATEVCNGIDDDCEGGIDEGFDVDGDSFTSCGGDCDDGNPFVNPGATEICNGIDDDCDSSIDEGVTTTFFLDNDNDNYGQTGSTIQACTEPAGYAPVGGDCNDSNPAINPGAQEVCDGADVDEDCDGLADDNDPSAVGETTWYQDSDGDTYGNPAVSQMACDQPTGYVAVAGDCDDTDPDINPGEADGAADCDGIDNNCDGIIDDGDTDGDNIPNCSDADDDNDMIPDTGDNCPLVANTDQADTDMDGIGDACDGVRFIIEYPGLDAGTVVRCIRFEFFACGGTPNETIEQSVVFINGVAQPTLETVDCAAYDCVTIRDTKHSLAQTVNIAPNCQASFTGADALMGGNLNGDRHIDILDFGVFSGQFGTTPFVPPCPNGLGFHADISGDGDVFTEDFTFIQINFLETNDLECNCALPEGADGGGLPPITSITIPQLFQLGLGELMVADLNGDGVLDEDDIFAFMNGAVPKPMIVFEGAADVMPHWFEPLNWTDDVLPDEASDVGIGVLAVTPENPLGAAARDVLVVNGGVLELAAFGEVTARSVALRAGATIAMAGEGAVLAVQSLLLESGAAVDWSGGVIDVAGGELTVDDPDLTIGGVGGVGRNTLRLREGAQAVIERDVFVGSAGGHSALEIDKSSLIAGGTISVGSDGDAELVLVNGGTAQASEIIIGALGSVRGDGELLANLTSHGRIIVAAGAGGPLVVRGQAELGGALEVQLLMRRRLIVGESFELIRADGITGKFETLHLPVLAGGMEWRIVYEAKTVRLQVVASNAALQR